MSSVPGRMWGGNVCSVAEVRLEQYETSAKKAGTGVVSLLRHSP
jgi:hypothetical protein